MITKYLFMLMAITPLPSVEDKKRRKSYRQKVVLFNYM